MTSSAQTLRFAVAVIAMATGGTTTGCRAVLGIEEADVTRDADPVGDAGDDGRSPSDCSKIVATMRLARYGHSLTTMPNGRVVAAGGFSPAGRTAEVEEYDPSSDRWSALVNPLPTARSHHAAVLLDDGNLLLIGGYEVQMTPSTVVYSPSTGAKSTASMLRPRVSPSALRLSDGKVLVAGGVLTSTGVNSTEVYDRVAGTWSDGATMMASRRAVVLAALGDTIFAASVMTATTEKLAGGAGSWTSAGDLPFTPAQIAGGAIGPRVFVTARLNDGSMVAASSAGAGWSPIGGPGERFTPALVAPLPGGRLLWVGGDVFAVLDTTTQKWIRAGRLQASHQEAALASLPDGRVLIVGGRDVAIAEVFDPRCL
jgi:hypothetical protein